MNLVNYSLAKPAHYFPFEKGRYEVAPGLRPFGTDFGNGELDRKFFQIDREYKKYYDNKVACRTENIEKYYMTHSLSLPQKTALVAFLSSQLTKEYPQIFESGRDGSTHFFINKMSGEKISWGEDLKIRTTQIKYQDALDALASQICEDIALVNFDPASGADYLSMLHLCAAAHWSPADKIGQNFMNVHVPVPHIEKINSNAKQFVEVMIKKGPFVRFAWGFSSDTRLNHHPEPPPGVSLDQWLGRSYTDPSKDKIYVRVERQTTLGFPEHNMALFTIRPTYLDEELLKANPELTSNLISAITSMSEHSRRYKGLKDSFEPVLARLRSFV